MKKNTKFIYIILLILLSASIAQSQDPQYRVAIIGDYGNANASPVRERAVAELVHSWNNENSLDAVLTMGDNNYNAGEYETIHQNIGAYYSRFIQEGVCPSSECGDCIDDVINPGEPCVWSETNLFWPSAGNHDYGVAGAVPYYDYFNLPGNERYYDFTLGDDVHFFVLNSNGQEPDGVGSTSVQAEWLESTMDASDAKWKIVYFHHPPYSSAASNPNAPNVLTHRKIAMQWPFKEWGADIVLSGHAHNYERFDKDCLPYVVNGLGGRISLYPFHPQVYEDITDNELGDIEDLTTEVRFNGIGEPWQETYGAMSMEVFEDVLSFEFVNVEGDVLDAFDLLDNTDPCNIACNPPPPPLMITSGSDIVWNELMMLNQDVHIEAGATLTIKSVVQMGPDRNFTVKRGGKLVIDGGTLTKLCDDLWRGIYVWGNANKPQPDPLGVQQPDDTGILIIKGNSLIEYAKSAVVANAKGIPYSQQVERWGGLIIAENCHFYNNVIAGGFMKYDFENKSRFKKCHFAENGEFNDNTAGVTIWACNGITFEENIFENLDDFGIYGIDHSIKVINNNSFINNKFAIESKATLPFSTATQIGQEGTIPNYFINNEVHVKAYATESHEGLNVIGNEFFDAEFGVYILGPTQYNIRGNSFFNQGMGILSAESNDYTNFIDCNNIQNVNFGIIARGNNRLTQIRGNNFKESDFNIFIQPYNDISGEIRNYQGSPFAPAMNCFSESHIADILAIGNTIDFNYFTPSQYIGDCDVVPNSGSNYNVIPTPLKIKACGHGGGQEKEVSTDFGKDIHDLISKGEYDKAENILVSEASYKSQKWLYAIQVMQEKYVEAKKVLDQLPASSLDQQYFNEIQLINLEFRASSKEFVLRPSQETFLHRVANSDSRNKGYAQALLFLLKNERFDFDVDLPEGLVEAVVENTNHTSNSIDQFKVQPNPVKDNFTLYYPSFDDQRLTFGLYDLQGRQIINKELDGSGRLNITNTDLVDGVYFVKVFGDSGVSFQTKIIVVK